MPPPLPPFRTPHHQKSDNDNRKLKEREPQNGNTNVPALLKKVSRTESLFLLFFLFCLPILKEVIYMGRWLDNGFDRQTVSPFGFRWEINGRPRPCLDEFWFCFISIFGRFCILIFFVFFSSTVTSDDCLN